MIFENNDKIVFAGDSVTDMGSAGAVAEGLFDNLGHGYVRMVSNLLGAIYPDMSFRIVNSGISGNTSRDLLNRYESDVVNQKPDWVSICIGINDVWRQFDMPATVDWQVQPDEYRENVEKMILAVKDSVKGVFLLTPYFMEPLKEDKMRKRMDEYVAIIKELAEKYNCILVDFQSMYDKYFEDKHSAFIAWDRIHPNETGATLMAREFLSHCGFDFNR